MRIPFDNLKITAINARRFSQAQTCREIAGPEMIPVLDEMIESLNHVENDREAIAQYEHYYKRFDLYSISHNQEIILANARETRDRLIRMKQDIAAGDYDKKSLRDICTGYISYRASEIFPKFWFHLDHRTLTSLIFSQDYIEKVTSKSKFLRTSRFFEFAAERPMDTGLFYRLTGVQDMNTLDNHFTLMSRDEASKILDEIESAKIKEEDLKYEHAVFLSFLRGVVSNDMIVMFDYNY